MGAVCLCVMLQRGEVHRHVLKGCLWRRRYGPPAEVQTRQRGKGGRARERPLTIVVRRLSELRVTRRGLNGGVSPLLVGERAAGARR